MILTFFCSFIKNIDDIYFLSVTLLSLLIFYGIQNYKNEIIKHNVMSCYKILQEHDYLDM